MSVPSRPPRGLRLSAISLALGLAVVSISAGQEPGRQPFSLAELFIELNDTDHDLGLHAEIDGGAWTSLEVEGPGDRMLLSIIGKGRLRRQGLTQLAFESAEPAFEDLAPEEFFRRFPEGDYEIEARAQGGGRLESLARLSHVLAARVEPTVNGLLAAESCDAPVLPAVAPPVVIDWEPVTRSHPEVGKAGPIVISRYQFFLERGAVKLSLDLPPSITEFEIPAGLIQARDVYKYEIIARTSTGNNTAVESCFRIR